MILLQDEDLIWNEMGANITCSVQEHSFSQSLSQSQVKDITEAWQFIEGHYDYDYDVQIKSILLVMGRLV